MLSKDKRITTPEYWNKVYSGENMNATVDSSNTVRPVKTFDRFDIVVNHAAGKRILDIGSGHAHICKRIKHKLPESEVIASDQASSAKKVANYEPYLIFSGYKIPYTGKYFDLVICTQAMEYIEEQDQFMKEVSRVADNFICTVPLGNMEKWSQFYIYSEEGFCKWISKYGEITIVENYTDLLLVKIKILAV